MLETAWKEFQTFVDDFLDDYFAVHPEIATASGIHTFDHQISDFSQAAMARDVTRLKRASSRLKKFASQNGSKRGLTPQQRLDLSLMEGTLEAALFDLEEMRPWERNPKFYNDLVYQSLFLLIRRSFAPLEERVRAIIDRQRQIPAALQAAQKNLRGVPRIVATLAIRQFQGTLHFFKTGLPSAVKPVFDPKLRAQFEVANSEAISAYRKFIEFLRERILLHGKADFGIGESCYRKKVWLDERVDIPLDRLLACAYDSLAENHALFRQVAAQIDPGQSPHQLLEQMTQDHPHRDQIIDSTTAVLSQLRDFVIQSDLISLPTRQGRTDGASLCSVDESPEYLRELTFASLEVPGAFEKKSREFFYYVTLPDLRWSAEKREQHLRFFSHHLILTTSIHEAYPGHLVHFLWVNQHPSKIRRLFGAASHVEGWAHYCEQMMLDEGFGEGDLRLHLAQLHEAQLRLCRLIVGIEMHVNGMSLRRAKNFFVQHAQMQPLNAERETHRGVVDPTYLVYTLGKMQFLRLRQDLQKKQGSKFSIKKFHNACVQNGFPPIPLLRELLLGERRAVI